MPQGMFTCASCLLVYFSKPEKATVRGAPGQLVCGNCLRVLAGFELAKKVCARCGKDPCACATD